MLLLSLTIFLYSVRNLLQCWRHVAAKDRSHRHNLTSAVLMDDLLDPDVDDAEAADRLLGGAPSSPPADPSDPPRSLSYPTLVELSLGSKMSSVVSCMLMCQQFGIVLTYLIFVPTNVQKSLSTIGVDVSMEYLIKLMVLFQMPISWISEIKRLSFTNIAANCLIFYGLLSCLAVSLFVNSDPGTVLTNIPSLEPIVWKTFYLFIGTSVLLFEGLIALAIPLNESITDVGLSTEFPNIIARVLKYIVSFYSVFAIICWSSFGHPETVFTASLPAGKFATSVQVRLISRCEQMGAASERIVQQRVQSCHAGFNSLVTRTLGRSLSAPRLANSSFPAIQSASFVTPLFQRDALTNRALHDHKRRYFTHPSFTHVCVAPPLFTHGCGAPFAHTCVWFPQLCYSIAVLLTFPLQNFPALQILTSGVTDRLDLWTVSGRGGRSWKGDFVVRGCIATVAVCMLGVVANLIKDSLDHLVSLIGAFFGIPLAFVVPSLMHSTIMARDGLLTETKERLNLFVIVFGVITMVIASTATLYTWNSKEEDGHDVVDGTVGGEEREGMALLNRLYF